MGKLKVRRAKKRDHKALAKLMTQLSGAHRRSLTEKTAAKKLTLLLGADYEPWVACRDDAVIAYALVHENGDHVFIRQFAVAEDQRQKNVGRAFFEALEDAYGAPEFRLDVMDGSEHSRSFWSRLGFEKAAVNMRRAAQEEN